jgi:5-methylcytosine-specific restriction endonuclease McrA
MALKYCLGRCGRRVQGSYCRQCKPRPYQPERLRGRRWMKIRRSVMARAGGICEECGERLADEVHHVDGDLRNNALVNLRALCRPCHARGKD